MSNCLSDFSARRWGPVAGMGLCGPGIGSECACMEGLLDEVKVTSGER